MNKEEKDRLHKAANEYANSIAQHDERKTYCVEDFIAGAEWADKTMLDKACKWLGKHFYDSKYEFRDDDGAWIDVDLVLEDLKEAMEE